MEPDPDEKEYYPTPLLRRRGVLGTIAVLAAGSLLLLMLMSTCTSRRQTPAPPTTTIPAIVAVLD